MDEKQTTMNGGQRNRRRKLVIDKEVQTRIIYRITWVPLACLIIAAIALAFLCEEARSSAHAIGLEIPGILQSFLVAEFLIMMCGVALLRNSLVVSNRLAGPMYRFRQTFKSFMNGDREIRNHLRKRDFLKRTEADINKFLGWVQRELENQADAQPEETRETVAAAGTAEQPVGEDPVAVDEVPSPHGDAAESEPVTESSSEKV